MQAIKGRTVPNWIILTLAGTNVISRLLHAVEMEPVNWKLAAPVMKAIKEMTAHNWTRLTLVGQLVTFRQIHAVDTEPVIYWPLPDAPVRQLIQELTVPY